MGDCVMSCAAMDAAAVKQPGTMIWGWHWESNDERLK